MKVEVKEVEKKFEPIELVITIESEEELCSLWHRLFLSSNVVNNNSCTAKHKAISDEKLFNKLDDIAESLNLIG